MSSVNVVMQAMRGDRPNVQIDMAMNFVVEVVKGRTLRGSAADSPVMSFMQARQEGRLIQEFFSCHRPCPPAACFLTGMVRLTPDGCVTPHS